MASIAQWASRIKEDLLANPLIAQVLSSEVVEADCDDLGHRWRESWWSPTMTLMVFLLQVLGAAKSLRASVHALRLQLSARGLADDDLPSGDPSAFCQARRRLPETIVRRQFTRLGKDLAARMPAGATWLGRRVRIFDGSSVSMPDTPVLQREYPQHSAQAEGCGFPVAQFVGVFDWASGAILDIAIDNRRPHELTLFRKLWDPLESGDVVLVDRAYCNYVDIARLRQRDVDGVYRLHQRRKADFRTGKRLGHDDRLIVWLRPQQYNESCGISREDFEQLPAEMTVRMIRITSTPPGFRSRTIFVVTTLLDPVEFPADDIRALYRDRWTVELNFRSLKTQLRMEVLRGETPDVVRKELLMHLTAYNLIRLIMWEAAQRHGRNLHRLSFTATMHRLWNAMPLLLLGTTATTVHANAVLDTLLASIAADIVPNRPDRVEPRRKKRRPKPYSLLLKPRRWYHLHGSKDER
jgi:hypothetical protein